MEKTPRSGEGRTATFRRTRYIYAVDINQRFFTLVRAHLSITFQENYEKLIIHLRKFISVSRFTSSALSVLSSCRINFDFNFPQVIILLFSH